MTNWREIPLVRLTIPVVLGIVTYMYAPIIPQVAVHILLLSSIVLASILHFTLHNFRLRWLIGVLLSILFFSFGYEITHRNDELNNPSHFKNRLQHTDNIVTGIITNKVEKKDFTRLVISLTHILLGDSVINVSGNLLVYVQRDTANTIKLIHALSQKSSLDSIELYKHNKYPLKYGDLVMLSSTIREIEPPKNPDETDFQRYWHFQNIHYQTFIQTHRITFISEGHGYRFINMALRWNNHFIEVLKKHLATENEFAVASALLLGSRDAINEEIRNAYVETGAMHILAISGMHIILIFKHLEWLLNIYKTGNRRWRWVKSITLIVLISLFALLTGLGTSVTRAAVMASCFTIGKALNRRAPVINILAASALMLLLWNPYWLVDIGFQLSFMAVLGIVLFAHKFDKLIVIPNKIGRAIWSNISIGLAAQLMVTPLSLYYFHQFPTYFWLSGLLVGTIADASLLSGIGLLILDPISQLSYGIGKILFATIWLMNNIIFIIRQFPFSTVEYFGLTLLSLLLIYLIVFTTNYAINQRRLKLLYYPLSIGIVLALFSAFYRPTKNNHRHIIIYAIPRMSLVEIINDKKTYRFLEKNLVTKQAEKKIKFATENHHKRLKINELEKLDFNEYILSNYFIYQKGYIKIGQSTLIVLDKIPQSDITLHNCYVLVHRNATLSMHDLTRIVGIKQVIFDGSNSREKVEKWKKDCIELKMNYYDVIEKGAWVQTF